MTDKEKIQKLHDASCSDGNCVFKITPEMRKGMRTNGGCCCLKDMTYGIGRLKTFGVMELSQIASATAAALAAKDVEIARLKEVIARAYFGIRELKSQFEFCDCSDDPQDDICLHCILQNIMQDIEQDKTALEGK